MALLAIIISLIGTGVSIIEAGILREQQRLMVEEKEAAVWPYVSAGVLLNNDEQGTTVEFKLKNEGVGPALIGDIEHTMEDTKGVLIDILPVLRAQFPDLNILPTLSSSSTSKVLGAGESMVVYRLYVTKKPEAKSDPFLVSAAFSTTYCYCSIYGECWDYDGKNLEASTACSGRSFVQ